MSIQDGNSLVAQTEISSRLRSLGNFQHRIAFERRNMYLRAERGLRKRNRHNAIQVLAFAFKEGMLLYVEHYINVTRWSSVRASFTSSGEQDSSSLFHARRNFDFKSFLPHHQPRAFTGFAWIADDGTNSLARGAGAGDAEEPLLITNLSATRATTAGCRRLPGGRTRAVAGGTLLLLPKIDLLGSPKTSFLEGDRKIFAEIATPLRTCATASSRLTEHVAEAEHFAKYFAEVDAGIEAESAWTTRAAAVHPRMSELVISGTLLPVTQNRVSFAALFELVLCTGFRVAIRVELHRKFAVRAFDLLVGRCASDAKNFVVVAFGFRGQCRLPVLLNF